MQSKLSPAQTPILAATFRFQWEEAQDCYVVLYPEGMVKLSFSAGEIMKRCTGECTIAEILEDLLREFPETDLSADVYAFLEVAYNNGWLKDATTK